MVRVQTLASHAARAFWCAALHCFAMESATSDHHRIAALFQIKTSVRAAIPSQGTPKELENRIPPTMMRRVATGKFARRMVVLFIAPWLRCFVRTAGLNGGMGVIHPKGLNSKGLNSKGLNLKRLNLKRIILNQPIGARFFSAKTFFPSGVTCMIEITRLRN